LRRGYGAAMRVGLISDTHLPSLIRHLDALGPEPAAFLETVDLILHAGDVSTPTVLDWCEQFAPVLVARGNHDVFEDERIADRQVLELEGWRIGMTHDLRPRAASPAELAALHFEGAELDVMIAGDTHVEWLEHREGIVLVNSGSPNLPHNKETRLGTAGLLEIERGYLHAEIVLLGESADARNPGTAQHIEIEGGSVVGRSYNGSAGGESPAPREARPGG
jgi:putative phosphoesterase